MAMTRTNSLAGSACFILSAIMLFIYYQRGPIKYLHRPMSGSPKFLDLLLSDTPISLQLYPCEPIVKHLYYGKIEKTGSSTMEIMFSRFAVTHNLNVITPTHPNLWHINPTQPRGSGWIIGPGKAADRAEMLVNHMIYSPTFINKFLHNDTFKVTLIREPVSWFLSASNYFPAIRPKELHSYERPEDLVNDSASFFVKRNHPNEIPSYYHLGQLLWLGLNYSRRADMNYITEYVDALAKQFDFVMLNDQYDASIVLLRRKLCWNYKNMLYNKWLGAREDTSRRHLNPEATQKLLSADYNLGDKILYDYFNATWWEQEEVKDPSFWQEVQDFADIKARAIKSCQLILKNPQSPYQYQLNGTSTIEDMVLTQADCKQVLGDKNSLVEYAHGNSNS